MTTLVDSKQLKSLHRKAMEKVDMADVARRQGKVDDATLLLREALHLERSAASMLLFTVDVEPTRSVLYRSAASIAMRCDDFKEAERLIAQGLSGHPPEEIAEELRDLYEQVTFERHLALRGVSLQTGEFQLSLAGPGVGAGMAPTEATYQRISTIQKMLFRTAERKTQREFRTRGGPSTEIKELYETFTSVPRVASFAVTVRLGAKAQMFGAQDEIIRDVLDNLKLVQAGDVEELGVRIPEEPYFNNFVALATELAPDGKEVTLVGLTSSEEKLALRTEREVLRRQISAHAKHAPRETEEEKTMEIVGVLDLVEGRGKDDRVEVTDDHGAKWSVLVMPGLMDDVVAPNWRKRVKVSGRVSSRRKNTMFMETMVSAD